MNNIYIFVFFVLSLFSNGKWIFPVAVWIAPVFLVRYLRKQKPIKGSIFAFFIYYISSLIIWKGMIPVDITIYFLIVLGISAVGYMPFLIDRFLSKYENGFLSTLILPLAGTLFEFVYALTSPYGIWGTLAVTQVNCIHLIQIVSLTGMWGITFLIYWFASTVNWIWEDNFEFKKIWLGVSIFTGCILVVLIYGNIMVNFFHPDSKTVRIASVSPTGVENRFSAQKLKSIIEKIDDMSPLTRNEINQFKNYQSKFNDELFQYTEKEAGAGAKIILWSECGAWILMEEKEDFLKKCKAISKNYEVYILASLCLIDGQANPAYCNISYLIQPDGKINQYIKTKIVPGDFQQKGDGRPFIIDTPYGKLGNLICFDMDFPLYLKKVKDADILLVPGNDWKDIDPYHTQMDKVAAIEFGFNEVRQATKGLSASYNYRGNTLSTSDYFTDTPSIMISNVPEKGIVTPYSILGEWFIYLCLIGFIILIIKIIIKKKDIYD